MKTSFYSKLLLLVAMFLLFMGSTEAFAATAGGYESVSAGWEHNLAVKADGSLWAWGSNKYGQLGDGTASDRHIPVKIMDGVVSVSAGGNHSLAIKADGSLWAWGWNLSAQLGDSTTADRYTPVKIMDNVVSAAAGGEHSLAIMSDGSLWAWGSNWFGQLGNGATNYRFMPVKIMDDVVSVAAGWNYNLAIKTDGSLWAWGWNGIGQLGDGTKENKYIPVKVMDDVMDASAKGEHSLAVKTDGSLWTWGSNSTGQLGDGSMIANRATPAKIMDEVVSVAAGGNHSLAIKTDNSVWAWGSNWFGQLGNGANAANDNMAIPVGNPVKILDDATVVAAGGVHSLAVKTGGSLWTWGNNEYSQLGDGTVTIAGDMRMEIIEYNNKSIPVKVMDGIKLTDDEIKLAVDETELTEDEIKLAADEIKVLLNGVKLAFDQPPIIDEGRTLVPLRVIFEALGAEVAWDQPTQTVSAIKEELTLSLTIGNNILTKNEEEIVLDVPAKIVGARTLVPVRAVAESFGAEVLWDQDTRTVLITDYDAVAEAITEAVTDAVTEADAEADAEPEILSVNDPAVAGKKIPILMYHAIADVPTTSLTSLFVRPKELEAQLKYIAENGYQSITFEDLDNISAFSKPIMLTFDDGYKDNYTILFPLLQKYAIKATIFVVTDTTWSEGRLSQEDIVEMSASGLVSIQSHTKNHYSLTSLRKETLVNELSSSKDYLEVLTGKPVIAFCYPEGAVNAAVRSVTAEYYSYAVLNYGGMFRCGENTLMMNRIRINRGLGVNAFAALINI